MIRLVAVPEPEQLAQEPQPMFRSARHKTKKHKTVKRQLVNYWLTESQKASIVAVLKERIKDKSDVRLECWSPAPKFADQIAEAFDAAGWPLSRLNKDVSGWLDHAPDPMYVHAPNGSLPAVSAVLIALESARLAPTLHIGITRGPVQPGVPTVTIEITSQ